MITKAKSFLAVFFIALLSLDDKLAVKGSKTVPVIAFQPKRSLISEFKTESIPNGHVKTRDFTACLRYMAYFTSDSMTILETKQTAFGFYNNIGYVFLRPWNASTANDEYRRIIAFCKPYEPGYWISLCLRVELEGDSQTITFFQDGSLCFKHTFLDGHFEWLYFKENMAADDILR